MRKSRTCRRSVVVEQVYKLKVPGLDAERHLVVLRAAGA
jgi:16S rRNA G527 N7-methylase RsmG